MNAYTTAEWLPALRDLLARRPDLAGIGLADMALEVGA